MLREAATALIPRANTSFLLPPTPNQAPASTRPIPQWPSAPHTGSQPLRGVAPQRADGQFHRMGRDPEGPTGMGVPLSHSGAFTCPSSPQTLVMRAGAGTKAALGDRNLPSLLIGFHCQLLPALCFLPQPGVCKGRGCQRGWQGATRPSCSLSCPLWA